jgi:hypothetical protein
MEYSSVNTPPRRITDIVALKQQGADVACDAAFEVVPVDFIQRDNPYKAHVFLCRYSGTVDGKPFTFRKCYARGCSHNLCPHVSQAVMIANRYLQRDYRSLSQAGIAVPRRLYTLDDMVVKFEDYHEEHGPTYTIDDYINIAREGNAVSIEVELEYLPAVEHFSNYESSQIFLHANFHVTSLGKTHPAQRCLSCYPTDAEAAEKPAAVRTANTRLDLLYHRFDTAGITYQKQFFS